MKKQLPITEIANELSGASAFFPKPESQSKRQGQTTPEHRVVTRRISQRAPQANPKIENLIRPTESKNAHEQQDTHDESLHQAIIEPSNHATIPPHHHDTVIPTVIETIRKVVKQIGKEAATHRFTEEEKRRLADIVYTYERQGYRTSENEITRIAINWLMLDYDENGANSVLARLLESLHR